MAPRAYYNEIEPYAAGWLRNLISSGLIPDGDVDERSIADVRPADLDGYTQCHFFAGIGGWPAAARMAGWADDRPMWTGSCPCQPFSFMGQQRGFADERHLWPIFRDLIAQRRPAVVFGEQVARATEWLCVVRSDLEALDYAVGAIPLEAASAGADHLRDRYWFVAHHDVERPCAERPSGSRELGGAGGDPRPAAGVAQPSIEQAWGRDWTEQELRAQGVTAAVRPIQGRLYVECGDGRWRRAPPSRVRCLGYGIPARVAQLRAFGNAIDPRAAAAVIDAFLTQ